MKVMTEQEREERAHRPISPSGLKKIISCPGSFALSQKVKAPKTTSKAAIDGNTTGTLLEHVLNKIFDERFSYKVHVGADYKTMIGASIDELKIEDNDGKRAERILDIIYYLNRWREEVIEVYVGCEFFHFSQEQFVECWDLEGGEGVGGSADILIAWRVKHDVCFAVLDLKDGQVPVYASYNDGLNPQLVAYAAGFARYLVLKKLALPNSFSYIHLGILQPRTDNYDSAIIRWNLENVIRDSLKNIIKKTKEQTELAWSLRDKEDVTEYLKVTEDCRYCQAKMICPKFYEENKPLISVGTLPATETPSAAMIVQGLTTEQKVQLVKNRKLLEEVVKEVRKELVESLLSGNKIGGVKLVSSKPDQTTWSSNVSVEERKKLLRDIGVNPIEEKERSYANVKKEVGDAVLKELNLAEVKSFGITVVAEKERGKEIVITGNNEQLFIASEEEEND